MKLFSRYYARRIYRTSNLKELIYLLLPWVDEVLYPGSPFLRQIASHYLIHLGGSRAPRKIKQFIGDQLLEINSYEDMKASILLAIVETYHSHNIEKGTDLINWMSWQIPYEVSKTIFTHQIKPLGPYEEAYIPKEIEEFELSNKNERQFDIICKDLKVCKQLKRYYKKKRF